MSSSSCKSIHMDCDEHPRMQHKMGSTPARANITPHISVPQQNSSKQTLTSEVPMKSHTVSELSMGWVEKRLRAGWIQQASCCAYAAKNTPTQYAVRAIALCFI